MYTPPGGDSHDWPTQQLGPIDGQHGRAEAAGPRRADGGAGSTTGARSGRRGLRRGIAAAAAAVLLCGGAAAGVALADGTSSASAGPTGQAAVLNTMLSSASSPAGTAAGFTATTDSQATAATAARCRNAAGKLRAAGRLRAARAVRRGCRGRLRRLRVLAGIHGQFTFETKTGPRTLAFERGVVESVSSAAISVRAQDGTTWTWDLVGNTVVRENGRRAAKTALSAGQKVFAGGPVSGGANDAALIVIRPASSAAGSS